MEAGPHAVTRSTDVVGRPPSWRGGARGCSSGLGRAVRKVVGGRAPGDGPGDAADGGGGVLADTRKFANQLRIPGKDAVVFSDDLTRCVVQVSSARVIAEPCPVLQHFILWGTRKRLHVRVVFHESIPVRNHRCHTSLLKHHFGEPDRVGIFHTAPGQLQVRAGKPLCQCSGDLLDHRALPSMYEICCKLPHLDVHSHQL